MRSQIEYQAATEQGVTNSAVKIGDGELATEGFTGQETFELDWVSGQCHGLLRKSHEGYPDSSVLGSDTHGCPHCYSWALVVQVLCPGLSQTQNSGQGSGVFWSFCHPLPQTHKLPRDESSRCCAAGIPEASLAKQLAKAGWQWHGKPYSIVWWRGKGNLLLRLNPNCKWWEQKAQSQSVLLSGMCQSEDPRGPHLSQSSTHWTANRQVGTTWWPAAVAAW